MAGRAASDAVKAVKALDLRRAGVPLDKIQQQLGFKTPAAAERAIAQALKATGQQADPIAVRKLELDRLDRLQTAIWPQALRGDKDAIEAALKLTQARLQIAGIQEAGLTPLTEAYDKTVTALDIDPERDAALIAFGRRYCEQVDAASSTGDPIAVIKALHLMPHVTNVLRELGATPAASAALKEIAKTSTGAGGNVTALAAWRNQAASG